MKLGGQEAEFIDHGEKEKPSDRINRIDRIFPALRMRAGNALENHPVQLRPCALNPTNPINSTNGFLPLMCGSAP
jgi:hypothetical protein